MYDIKNDKHEDDERLRFSDAGAEEYLTIIEKGVDEDGDDALLFKNDDGEIICFMEPDDVKWLIKALEKSQTDGWFE